MPKAANTYWDNGRTAGRTTTRRAAPNRRPRAKATRKARRKAPWWLSVIIVASIFVMLTVSINLRAFNAIREEATQHTQLSSQIQNLMDENLALQEEIHTIKSDPRVIEREAKKLRLDLKTSQ